ncbi:MAG TPA: endonuclease/exonuclease/phosphatase family protein [Ktedonobacterales bacterium]|jgi:exodeoxyribonuclease-3|nr:endonuclease/exonuclease/phosphatase family protein [Ktedonobacterales bacterium]
MPLRALTYNILVGGEERLPFIRDIILGQSPDIVAIQEANSRENVEELARALEMRLIIGEANSPFLVALLTRLPVTGATSHHPPEFEKAALEVETQWDGQPLRVITTHLKPHIHQEAARAEEARTLLRLTGPAGGANGDELRLLMGDFNALSPDDRFIPDMEIADEDVAFAERAYAAPRLAIPPLLAAGYVDLFRRLRPGEPGYTALAPTPVTRIDYIFASPAMARRATYCDRVTSPLVILASDHMPVRADFE